MRTDARTIRTVTIAVATLLLGAAALPALAAGAALSTRDLPAPLPLAADSIAPLAPEAPLSSPTTLRAMADSADMPRAHMGAPGDADPAAEAQRIVASLLKREPKLGAWRGRKPMTVRFGPTPAGYQAVAYYRIGEIVVDPKHTAPLERILAHEAGHVLDWRDNGRIDWGEQPKLP